MSGQKLRLALDLRHSIVNNVTVVSDGGEMDATISLGQVLSPTLRGKIDGRLHFGILCTALVRVRAGGLVRLDFRGVEDVSASWIAAALLPLLPWSALPEHELFPVLTGIGQEAHWADEFDLVANHAHAVFVAAPEPPERGHRIIGSLDEALVTTMRLVERHGEVTGAGLKRLCPGEPIGATGWSNRLKDLHTKRLLRRSTRGREQVYTMAMEVNLDGPAGAGVPDRELPEADAARSAGVPPT
jgi:hypothetical protein